MIIKKSIILLMIIWIAVSCDHSTNPKDSASIEINLPIGKKAVYALGIYNDGVLYSLEVYSVIFESITEMESNNIMSGIVEANYLFSDSNKLDSTLYKESGSIKVTIGDKWIQFEDSEVLSSINIFMKSFTEYQDTTKLPDEFHSHFPAYPRIIKTNTEYSVFRPENSGSEWSYIGLGRKFFTKDFLTWNDYYGSDKGIFIEKSHDLHISTINSVKFKTIIDEHGTVISQSYNFPSNKANSVIRRIVDFTEPENVKDLEYYLNLVRKNGIKLINTY